jgi:hypothetical protein
MDQFKEKHSKIEGKLGLQDRIMTIAARPKYKPADHAYRIGISENTKIIEVLNRT